METTNASVPESRETLEHLFEEFLRRSRDHNDGQEPGLRDWVDLAEAWRITQALKRCRGNRSAAARMLGIGRRTLYSKMDKLHIEPTFEAWSSPR